MSPLSIDAFLLETLPALNHEALRGNLPVTAFLREVTSPIEQLAAAARQIRGQKQAARELLGQLGMIVSSAECHSQAAGQKKGAAIAVLHLDEVLLELGRVADHPPRDTQYSLWLWNPKEYRYTGNAEEKLFARMVRSTVENLERSCRRLRFLAAPDTELRAPEVLGHVQRATELHELHNQLLEALAGRREAALSGGLPGSLFTFEFGTYLTSWPVAGRMWDGPTAANFAPVFEADLRLSPVSDCYRAYIQGRLHLLPGEEQRRIRAAMEAPTVEENVLRQLGLPPRTLPPIENAHLDELVRASRLAATLQALERYVVSVTLGSKIHLELLRKKPGQPARAALPAARFLPVAPNQGAGGGSFWQELLHVLELRRKPPILCRLFEAARRVGRPAGKYGPSDVTGGGSRMSQESMQESAVLASPGSDF